MLSGVSRAVSGALRKPSRSESKMVPGALPGAARDLLEPPRGESKMVFRGGPGFSGGFCADPPGGNPKWSWGSPGLCPGVFGIPPGANRILRAPPRLNLKRCFKDFVLPPRGHKELQALGGKQSQGQKLCITFFQIRFWNLGASAALNPKSC